MLDPDTCHKMATELQILGEKFSDCKEFQMVCLAMAGSIHSGALPTWVVFADLISRAEIQRITSMRGE